MRACSASVAKLALAGLLVVFLLMPLLAVLARAAWMATRSVAFVAQPHTVRDLGFACVMGAIGAGILLLIDD